MIGPEIVQAAQTAAAAGGKSTIVLDAGMIALIISNIGAWIALFKRVGQKPKELGSVVQPPPGNPGNGVSSLLREHGEKLQKHETEISGIRTEMTGFRTENREDHLTIFKLLRGEKE